MKLKKFFIRTVLAVSILNFMNVNLTFAQVPSKQALVQTKEAKIKTDKMDNTGNIDKDTGAAGLYRFELLNDGSWSAPQLLARNISNVQARFIYVTNCAIAASAAGTEKYKLGDTAFITDNSVTVPPTGIELTLTPSNVTMDANVESAASNNIATNATDLTPIILNATMRGANVCANR